VASFALSSAAGATLDLEETGRSMSLPAEFGDHWVWAGDIAIRRTALFDADTGRMLGSLNAGRELRPVYAYGSRERGEFYVVETYYDRGHRGERFSIVTIYDGETLEAVADVDIPAKVADGAMGPNYAAVLDDERFLVVLNQTPATSISVVDLAKRTFVGEIETPGCVLTFPAGERKFLMLCGDGKPMLVTLNATGREISRTEGDKFFDSVNAPVSDRAGRIGDVWYFLDYEGGVHPVDVSGTEPKPLEPWHVATDADLSQGWRPGGRQHVAAHERSGRLFVVMHEKGGPGSHKDAGFEIWVMDVAAKKRVERFTVPNLLRPFLETQAAGSTSDAIDPEGKTFWGSLVRRVADWVVPSPGADSIVVTRDLEPLLIVGHTEYGALAVLDAQSGDYLRDIAPTGIVGGGLTVP
jgi:methylamine dehydrogenase heavy chain